MLSSPSPQDKVKAAGDMIKKLRSKKATLVQSVEKLCEAFIDLAYHDVTAFKKERGPVKLPSSCLLLKLGRLREVAMPTVCLLYTSPSPRDLSTSRMPSSA